MQRNGNDTHLPPPKRQKRAEQADVVIDMPLLEPDKKHELTKQEPAVIPVPAPPLPGQDLSQRYLLRYLNLYLMVRNIWDKKPMTDLIDESGYCHGLTLTWAAKMADYAEREKFYHIKRAIVSCPYQCHPDISLQDDYQQLAELLNENVTLGTMYRAWFNDVALPLEKFLAQIEWAQNSKRYTEQHQLIAQSAVDQILEIASDDYRVHDGAYTANQLENFLKNLATASGTFLVISGGGALVDVKHGNQIVKEHRRHTVGIFIRDSQWFFYDANEVTGCAIKCESSHDLLKQVIMALYQKFNQPTLQIYKLQIKEIFFQNVKLQVIRRTEPLKIVIQKSALLTTNLSNVKSSESNSAATNPFSYLLRRGLELFRQPSNVDRVTDEVSDEKLIIKNKLK
jgi:hypothetical protein